MSYDLANITTAEIEKRLAAALQVHPQEACRVGMLVGALTEIVRLRKLLPALLNDAEKTNAAIAHLHKLGYTIRLAESSEWITPGQFQRRLGLKSATFSKRLHHPDAPDFPRRMGEAGQRITKLQVTDALAFWMALPLAQGKRANALKRTGRKP